MKNNLSKCNKVAISYLFLIRFKNCLKKPKIMEKILKNTHFIRKFS